MCHSLDPLIAKKGTPVYWGRSLTYRFAIASPLALLAVVDPKTDDAAPLGVQWSAVVNYFLEAGALATGRLPLGWTSEDLRLAQRYSGPGASYWAFRAFVSLLLPAQHPFWTDAAAQTTSDSTPRGMTWTGRHVMATGLVGRSLDGVSIFTITPAQILGGARLGSATIRCTRAAATPHTLRPR